MNSPTHPRLAAALLGGLLAAAASPLLAQPERTDPTLTPAAMADALRAQLAEFRALTIHALVVGADDDGVALLETRRGIPLAAAAARADGAASMVRAGMAVGLEVGSVPVRLTVKSVSSRGVEVEAPTLSDRLFIPGSFKALPAASSPATGFLRYLECKELPLETLLRLIADQTGANLSASAEAAQVRVSIFLRNVPADTAVEEICRTCNLWFRKDDATGITRVTTMEEYETNLSTFREETTESFTLLYPNVFEVASVIYGLYPERVSLSLGEEEVLEDETRDISRRFERLNMISSSSGSSFMNSSMGGSGGGGSYGGNYGGNYGGSYGGGGLSVLRNGVLQRSGENGIDLRARESYSKLTANDAKRLDALLRQNDTNTTQRLLDGYREKNASIFVTASKRNNLLVIRTGDPQVMSEIRDLIRRLDVPTPMVLLEVKVMRLSLNNDFSSSFEYEFNKTFNPNSSDPVQSTGGFPGFNPLASAARTDSMSFQVLSEHLNVRIQMLEKEGRIKTLATPSLLTANSEVSRLFIGEERPMVRNISSETVVTDENVVTTPQTQTELQPVGTMLLITPNINADRTVTLRLLQENSDILKNDATIPVVSSAGVVQNVPIDVVSSRSVSGTFVAKDEMIVAVGGLIEEKDELQESKVPYLGDLPYLGFFFKSTQKVKTRSELLLLIKPHVISTPSEGEAISRRVLSELSLHPARDGRPSLGILKKQAAEENEKSRPKANP